MKKMAESLVETFAFASCYFRQHERLADRFDSEVVENMREFLGCSRKDCDSFPP